MGGHTTRQIGRKQAQAKQIDLAQTLQYMAADLKTMRQTVMQTQQWLIRTDTNFLMMLKSMDTLTLKLKEGKLDELPSFTVEGIGQLTAEFTATVTIGSMFVRLAKEIDAEKAKAAKLALEKSVADAQKAASDVLQQQIVSAPTKESGNDTPVAEG